MITFNRNSYELIYLPVIWWCIVFFATNGFLSDKKSWKIIRISYFSIYLNNLTTNLLLYKLCIIYTANYKYWAKHLISGLFLYPKIKLNTKIFIYDPIKTIIANPYLLHCDVYWLAYFGLPLLDRKQTRYCLYWFHHRVY